MLNLISFSDNVSLRYWDQYIPYRSLLIRWFLPLNRLKSSLSGKQNLNNQSCSRISVEQLLHNVFFQEFRIWRSLKSFYLFWEFLFLFGKINFSNQFALVLLCMTEKAVFIFRNGPVMTIEINRPNKRNAVDRETATQLANAFR